MFESPKWRGGSTGRRSPLTLDGEHDDGAPDVDRKAAVPALAERLTGVRVTESLLADAAYEWGFVSGYFA
ncbi:DUF6461 domain-containing protein [Streptomyces werraensis]|uniref:DUF6461 domain-containing protein n=1 Tax=Streptomyces werraensis TaxID=68284 RepID=UPI0036A1D3C8